MNGYIQTIREKIGHDLLMIVGAGVCPVKNGKMLLQRRSDNGLWALHGGCVEPGETPEQAARRELLEETGLTAGALRQCGVYAGPDMFYTYPNGDQVYIIAIEHICEDFTGEPIVKEEVSELRWFAPGDLPPDITPTNARSIAHIAKLLLEENHG